MATEVAVPVGAGAEVRKLVRRWLPDGVVRVGVCMELGEGRTGTTVERADNPNHHQHTLSRVKRHKRLSRFMRGPHMRRGVCPPRILRLWKCGQSLLRSNPLP